MYVYNTILLIFLKHPDVFISQGWAGTVLPCGDAQDVHGTFEPAVLDLEPSLADVPRVTPQL